MNKLRCSLVIHVNPAQLFLVVRMVHSQQLTICHFFSLLHAVKLGAGHIYQRRSSLFLYVPWSVRQFLLIASSCFSVFTSNCITTYYIHSLTSSSSSPGSNAGKRPLTCRQIISPTMTIGMMQAQSSHCYRVCNAMLSCMAALEPTGRGRTLVFVCHGRLQRTVMNAIVL